MYFNDKMYPKQVKIKTVKPFFALTTRTLIAFCHLNYVILIITITITTMLKSETNLDQR